MLNGKRKQLPDLPDAVIDPKSFITQSVIGNGSEVEAGAVIDKSVLLDGCRIGANSEILGSVLSEDVYVGQGARLDGCVIGQGQHIQPGEVLMNESRPEVGPANEISPQMGSELPRRGPTFLQPTGIDLGLKRLGFPRPSHKLGPQLQRAHQQHRPQLLVVLGLEHLRSLADLQRLKCQHTRSPHRSLHVATGDQRYRK